MNAIAVTYPGLLFSIAERIGIAVRTLYSMMVYHVEDSFLVTDITVATLHKVGLPNGGKVFKIEVVVAFLDTLQVV